MSTALSSRLLLVTLGLLGLLTFVGVTSSIGDVDTADLCRCQGLPEPPAAAAFIQAERDKDVEGASLAISPLFRAELERRGRGTEWPFDGLWLAAAPGLDFAYLGAVTDDLGFTYALYKARPKHSDGPNAPTSLWRIDLDPKGKVIWGELVRDFGRAGARSVCVSGEELLAGLSPRYSGEPLPTWWPSLAFGMRSDRGDGYVALLGVQDEGQDGGVGDRVGVITFASIDELGKLRPGYWSFGRPEPTWNDDEELLVGPGFFDPTELDSADLEVLEAYLLRLWSSPLRSDSRLVSWARQAWRRAAVRRGCGRFRRDF